ncbi:Nudix family hydrolase [Sulfurivirga sp.]|uniref:Nudix family hydrolase n=1 Tax=Sulfurivirga sp. TaxID=2614236 RepID=UPI0025DE4B26|nr:Nudix family hydrolase [Sulfurivirga sp.]
MTAENMTVDDSVLHIVLGAVRRDGRVLLERRRDDQHQGGLWAFPGGKVEAGETPEAALSRELREETGLEVSRWRPLIAYPWDYEDRRLHLTLLETEVSEGSPVPREGQALEWVPVGQLARLAMPPANRGMVRALMLPERLAITGAFDSPEQLYERVVGLLNQGHRLIQWRAPWLSRGEYVQHARQLLKLCHDHGARLLLNGDPALLNDVPAADGLHLPSRYLNHLTGRWLPPEKLLGCSVHSQEEIAAALRGMPDYLVLSPIQPTASHPEAPPLGWDRAARLIELVPVPVYALGGLDGEAVPSAREKGFQGVAAISAWWSSA